MKLTWWKRALMVAGLVAFGMLASRPWQVRSAEPSLADQPGKYHGSETCEICHSPNVVNATKYADAKKFIKMDEWTTWNRNDKHSKAYENLTNERGRQMATWLRVPNVTSKEVGCLGCHSAGAEELDNRVSKEARFNPDQGVSCENCHGPFSGWLTPHLDSAFRTMPTTDWKELGFIDLRSAEGKAEKCLSCHIGNVAEKKVVTHQMYAAGHPPLPSIEVATFTFIMPRHWRLNAEPDRADDVKKSLGYKEGDLEQTKLAIVGAAVALRTSLKLLADEAKTGPPGQDWPDYARFDCWSCHHDLKRDNWRQVRGFNNGPPGRVPVAQWPLTLVEVGIERLVLLGEADKSLLAGLKTNEKALRDQANLRPFGRKDSLAKAAENYATFTNALVEKLGAAKYDRAVALILLRKLVEKAEASTPDYDSARHVAWTIQILVDDLGNTLGNGPDIRAILDDFEAGLKLKLPSGQYYKIEEQLGPALQVIGDYDPATFKKQLGALLKLIP
jgi:hypothetical protein